MKKIYFAAVVLTTCAGTACADASSVTVYGLLDAGVTRELGGADGAVTKLASGVQSGSRIGFKGVEDLGNGLQAIFKLENGFDTDTGKAANGGALFGRHAYVGLSGAYGQLTLGRQCNPIFNALDGIDPFETGLTGSSTNLMSVGSFRTNNSVVYNVASKSGWSTTLMYGAGEQAGDSALRRTIGFSVDYANGPLMATLAYDRLNQSAINTNKLLLLGGSYNFGMLSVHAAYETEKNDVGDDFRDVMLGVQVPMGQGKWIASYIDKRDRVGARGGRQAALGYVYALSKRTNLYGSYGHLANDDQGGNMVGDASSGGSMPLAGHSSSALSVGIRHKF